MNFAAKAIYAIKQKYFCHPYRPLCHGSLFLKSIEVPSTRVDHLILILDNVVLQEKCLEWFPRFRAISLAVEEVEGETNEWRTLHNQLEATQDLVKTLSTQLADLRDQMTEQRKQKQRIGLLNNAPSLLNLGLQHNSDKM